jgi:hypothetical protein
VQQSLQSLHEASPPTSTLQYWLQIICKSFANDVLLQAIIHVIDEVLLPPKPTAEL